jgi:aspartyl-tRNA(Asn)/glutamyl-tRNA(Gln) amidotransferase subunit A
MRWFRAIRTATAKGAAFFEESITLAATASGRFSREQQPHMTTSGPTLAQLAEELSFGRTTSRILVEQCLKRIDDESGEGSRTFLHVSREKALKTADGIDALRAAGAAPSPFAGIPVSIKDLFDIKGDVTTAGSRALADAAPAAKDAPSVARLRRAGFVVMGRTNMTEFAYSGLGLNPHHGTPLNPWDRANGRIPGGSSSGAAVSLTDGMAHAALGTDTGGSCRIPAAFTGLVGFKPTARRVPLDGAVPLSPSLDSIGPIARSVGCCAALDAILADEQDTGVTPIPVSGLRLLVPTTIVLDGIDDVVAKAFERALSRLSAAGARITQAPFPEFDEIPRINAKGGFTAAESYAWHRPLLAQKKEVYDPRVSVRMQRGAEQSAADYIAILAARQNLIERANAALSPYDALVMPTVPMVAPLVSDLAEDEAYGRINLLALRNPTTINMIDGCAISLPMHEPGEAPTGFMLAGVGGSDRRVLAIAAGIEALLAGQPA